MSNQSNRADKSTETESSPPQGIFFGTASRRYILDGVVFDIEELEGLESIDVLETLSDAEISDSDEEQVGGVPGNDSDEEQVGGEPIKDDKDDEPVKENSVDEQVPHILSLVIVEHVRSSATG